MEPGTKSGEKPADFQEILERSLEQGLRNVLGESGFQMIIKVFPLGRLSTDPARFHEAMTSIFMERGAEIIEKEIGRRLLENIGNSRNRQGWWLRIWPTPGAPVRASEKEKRALQHFLALAAFPHEHVVDSLPLVEEGHGTSMELTAQKFAHAFKKGT